MRIPPGLIVLVFVAFPLAEIWLTIAFARAFGLWFLLYLALAAIVGAALIRSERGRIGLRLQAMLAGGVGALPALLFTFHRLAAGILLIVPGVLSDVAALALFLLPQRLPGGGFEAGRTDAGPQVIEGEFREVDAANDADSRLPRP